MAAFYYERKELTMKKIINPCTCKVYTKTGRIAQSNAFVKITYENGELLLHGVIGPMSNGNCKGSSGQCDEEIRNGIPKEPWTKEMIEKLCDIWDKWHLNDMRPYCQHQKEFGWRKQACEKITLYHYKLNDESAKKQKEVEKVALESLRCGVVFMPTDEQTMYASMEYFLDTYDKIEEGSELSKYSIKIGIDSSFFIFPIASAAYILTKLFSSSSFTISTSFSHVSTAHICPKVFINDCL